MQWARFASLLCAVGAAVGGGPSLPGARAASPDPRAVAFGTLPALWGLQIAPDGGKLVFLQMHPQDLPIAVVFDFASGEAALVLASEQGRFDLQWCRWASPERLLCGYRAVARDAGRMYPVTRLVAVNADGSDMKVLMQGRLDEGLAQFQDQIVDWLPDDPAHVLVQKPERGGTGVAKLDVHSGELVPHTPARDAAYHWMSDGRGRLRLRFLIREREYAWQHRPAAGGGWRTLREWDQSQPGDFDPIGFGDDPDELLVLRAHQGRTALWSEDLSGEREARVVFAHPEVDLGGALRLGRFRRMVAVGYSTDRDHLHFFDASVERIVQALHERFSDRSVRVVDESWDRRFYLVHVGSDRDPGVFYRYDAAAGSLSTIAPQYPKLEGLALAPMEAIHYEARDGTRIPAYLTRPASAPAGPTAAVVLPHGGPHGRDVWGYDWLAQFLSARGYAVLQSNYRGSSGFGDDWSGEGGFRDWRVAIDDLSDGARHLVASGHADPDRLCIAGWSYGGYAALLSAVEEPGLYRCVVSIAGVSDLPDLIDEQREYLGARGAKAFIGEDPQRLERGSPARRAGELRAPVLLLHPERDVNVRIEQSRKMAEALREHDLEVELVEYEGVEHDIFRNRYRVDLLDRIGTFLDRSTRPRSAAAP